MNTILVLVTSSPFTSSNCHSALAFCQAACSMGHKVQVFFYGEGIHNANVYLNPVSDEKNMVIAWQTLTTQFNSIELIVCNTAANKRGVISEEDAQSTGAFNLHSAFVAGGLAEFASLSQAADRMVQF